MTKGGKTIIIHQGSKFFWRTRNSIDISIIDHTESKVTEVISYEPSIDMEATRIYLDSTILGSKLDQEQIEEKLSFAKQNNVPHTEKFVSNIVRQAAVDYITNRLFLAEFSVDPKKFSVSLQFNFRDRDLDGDDSIDRLICEPPSGLTPFKIHHHKIHSAEEKDAAVQALAAEKQNLQEHCDNAIALQTQTALPLGVKERWRIPIVLAKLARGVHLSGADSNIWSAVASNLKSQEDIDRVTKATMRVVTPAEAVPEVASGGAVGKVASPSGRPPSSARTPLHTPHRSPCITPRSTSSRLLVGTISSQNRANSFAESGAPKLPRKLSKIGKRKSSIRRSKSRLLGAHSTSTDTDVDDSEPSVTTPHSTTTTFMSQLAAGLASLTSFKRSKLVYAEETDMMQNQFSFRGSMKADSAPLTCRETQDSAEVCEQRRSLAVFNPHLLGTTSTAPSLRGEFAFLTAIEPTPPLCVQYSMGAVSHCSGGAGIADRNESVVEVPVKSALRDEPTTSPARKRRSFFGTLLASISRADSSLSLGSTGSGKGGTGANGGHAHAVLRKQTSKRGGQMVFGEALSAWLSWGSAPVVPLDLPEYQPDCGAHAEAAQ